MKNNNVKMYLVLIDSGRTDEGGRPLSTKVFVPAETAEIAGQTAVERYQRWSGGRAKVSEVRVSES